jgi:Amt family ammonium transporter
MTAQISAGDTAWVLAGSALVMFMTPGLALFYGGMVRQKNVLGTIMQSFFIVAVVSVLWAIIGYSLAFGPDRGHLIGSLAWFGLRGVGQRPNADYAATIPALAFMIFQMMFAVITPALITGAFAERIKFKSFLLFIVLWSLVVYAPIAHWVWGTGGWLRNLGALDFAGGTVVHISSGAAALAAVLVTGRRRGYGSAVFASHNLPLTILGAAMLWFGWFGFNAASALSAGGLACSAFVATHLAAAAAALSWVGAEWLQHGKPTTLGAASGCVAGLVAVTPASGFVAPMPAIVIGVVAGAACYGAVQAKWRLGYDDSLDVVGIHGVGGFLGALLTGVFAARVVNAAGADGLIFGHVGILGVQAIAAGASAAYSFVVSFILFKIVDAIWGLRVSPEHEEIGLDQSQHGEAAYGTGI